MRLLTEFDKLWMEKPHSLAALLDGIMWQEAVCITSKSRQVKQHEAHLEI